MITGQIIIRNTNKAYLKQYKVMIGKLYDVEIFCDRYEFDNEVLYLWIKHDIIASIAIESIDNIVFERCV